MTKNKKYVWLTNKSVRGGDVPRLKNHMRSAE